MTPHDFIRAARVPNTLLPQEFGLWTIKRVRAADVENPQLAAFVRLQLGGFDSYTLLYRLTDGTLHRPPGDVVMEDSLLELERHLPIWLAARGRVLITGLGLGCVVRGLLASPRVDHVDVVEIDPDIMRIVGAEFAGNPRVTLHQGDALTYDFGPETRWDCAWHDLYIDDSAADLHAAHVQLIHNYRERIPHQGAWQLPRWIKRIVAARHPLLGAAA
jgi:hypothetical protein